MRRDRREKLLGGLFLQERIERGLRIAFDNQAFLDGATFTLFALRAVFLGHVRLLSEMFLAGVELVPQPGFGPGRPEWARGCKPRLSASSSTGHNMYQI